VLTTMMSIVFGAICMVGWWFIIRSLLSVTFGVDGENFWVFFDYEQTNTLRSACIPFHTFFRIPSLAQHVTICIAW
jgi:hypothetical protein